MIPEETLVVIAGEMLVEMTEGIFGAVSLGTLETSWRSGVASRYDVAVMNFPNFVMRVLFVARSLDFNAVVCWLCFLYS